MWLKKHVSDHSAVNHFCQVLVLSLNKCEQDQSQAGVTRQLDILELVLVASMRVAYTCAGHESLWYLRRMVSTIVCRCVQRWVHGGAVPLGVVPGGVCAEDDALGRARCRLQRSLGGEGSGGEGEEGEEEASDMVQTQKRIVHELFAGLRRLFRIPSEEAAVGKGVLSWLLDWMDVEIDFYIQCAQDSMSWDPALQKRHGKAYVAHFCVMVSNR
jgi:hypothetical protein